MKRILFITGSFPPINCGVGDYTYELVERLSKLGYDVTVITDKEASSHDGARFVVKNNIKKWYGIKFIFDIIKESKNGYDVIHIQFPTSKYKRSIMNYMLPMILNFGGQKVVYTIHEYANRGILYNICRLPAIIFSKVVIIVDPTYQRYIDKYFGWKKNIRVEYVKIGANIPKSSATVDEIACLRKKVLHNSKSDKIISYFGFINDNKCFDIILSAMNLLKEKGELDFILLIIGTLGEEGKETSYQLEMKKLIREFELTDYIYVTEYVKKEYVGDYFRISDASVLLFKNGISPRNGSYLAAVQENIPVITTINKEQNIIKDSNTIYINNDIFEVAQEMKKIQIKEIKSDIKINETDLWDEVLSKHMQIYNEI